MKPLHGRRLVGVVCLCLILLLALPSAAAVRLLPVAIEQGSLTFLQPRAWEAEGDVVVSWGLYNPLSQWIQPGTFTLELLDGDDQVVARTAGSNLLGRAALGPGGRAVEFGRLAGAAGRGQRVHLRMFPSNVQLTQPQTPLQVTITKLEPYWGDQVQLEAVILNYGSAPLDLSNTWLQIVFFQQDWGLVGTRPLSFNQVLAGNTEVSLTMVTSPLPPGMGRSALPTMNIWAPPGVRVAWQLPPGT